MSAGCGRRRARRPCWAAGAGAAQRLPAIAAEAKIAAASSQEEALAFLDRAERAALLSDPRLLERWAALPR